MTKRSILLVLSLAACGGATHPATGPAPAAQPAAKAALRIAHTAIYVDDQDKALAFYTDVLGFTKKDDVTNGPYRWLTVTESASPDATELQLAPDSDPAAKAYSQAMLEHSQAVLMLYTDDVDAQYARIKGRGGEFTMPPTDVTASTIAMLNDTCGNLIQLTQLTHAPASVSAQNM
jgi:predicted enzyme related to lactoylglutathione lyase